MRWPRDCSASATRVSGEGARQAWTQEQRHATMAAASSSACLACLRSGHLCLPEAAGYHDVSALVRPRPYLTHPEMPQFRDQIAECARELEDLGVIARSQHLRLSFHPSQYIILNRPGCKADRAKRARYRGPVRDARPHGTWTGCRGRRARWRNLWAIGPPHVSDGHPPPT